MQGFAPSFNPGVKGLKRFGDQQSVDLNEWIKIIDGNSRERGRKGERFRSQVHKNCFYIPFRLYKQKRALIQQIYVPAHFFIALEKNLSGLVEKKKRFLSRIVYPESNLKLETVCEQTLQ